MTDIDKLIINLIENNKGIKEISNILNMSEKKLYFRIKQIINYGYQLKPSYNYNSDIYYKIMNEEYEDINNEVSIKISNSNEEFRCIVISDTHIGNIDSDIDLLKKVYDYASKEGINIILNCGDLIEGVHSTSKKNINSLEDQMDFFVKKHPYDKNIRVFTILGNHDYHSLYYDGISILKVIKNLRYDIIPIGYGKGFVNIKKDYLMLEHELSIVENPEISRDTKISLVGHGHMMKTKLYDKLYLCIPSLSNVSPDKTKEIIPGFVDLNISFNHNKFDYIEAKHVIIAKKLYEASISRCRLNNFDVNDSNYSKSKRK